jgi:hypothetical protein
MLTDNAAVILAIVPVTITGLFSLLLGYLNRKNIEKVSKNMAKLETNTNNKMDLLLLEKDASKVVAVAAAHAEGKLEGQTKG